MLNNLRKHPVLKIEYFRYVCSKHIYKYYMKILFDLFSAGKKMLEQRVT